MNLFAIVPVLLVLWAGPAAAVEVKGLYEAEVAAADQGAPARSQAMTEAFARVLVKVSGAATAARPALLEGAQAYVQEYRYREAADAAQPGPLLWVRFDPAAVERLLRDNGLPVWGAARPQTLLWLVLEQGGERVLIGPAEDAVAEAVARERADTRGLPLQFPLLDLGDRRQLSTSDIWGGFFDQVLAVSQRYRPQAVLVGRVFPAGGGRWGGRWDLFLGDQRWHWETQADAGAAAIAAGVDGAADRIAEHFAHSLDGGPARLRLTLREVHDLPGFYRALEYLRSLHGVAEVRLETMDGSTAVLQVDVGGGQGALEQTLALGDTLVPVAVGGEAPPAVGGLVYRLLP